MKTILIVDDTPENIDYLNGILENHFNLKAAINGTLGLKIAEKTKPDLILLDIMMPDIDGYEVLKRLKTNKQTSEIPVILVSAIKQDQQKEIDFPIVGFIQKPIDADHIIKLIKSTLSL